MKTDEPYKIRKRIDSLEDMIKQELKNKDVDYTRVAKFEKVKTSLSKKLDILSNGISISDHALIRYFDRVMGIDTEHIRHLLLGIINKKYMGNGKYVLSEGVYAIITDKTVTTILDKPADYKAHDKDKGLL